MGPLLPCRGVFWSVVYRMALALAIGAGAATAGGLVLGAGCKPRPTFNPGTACELNTDCAAELVCRLGYCRIECRDYRDCPVGLECVLDQAGLGACQLPEETSCMLSSQCPTPLVCRQASCTNACMQDRDCPPGAQCLSDGTTYGCVSVYQAQCVYNSDCTAPLVCGLDRRCRAQCLGDRDCDYGQRCDLSTGTGVCMPVPAFGLDRLVLGGYHSCAVNALNDLYCWGGNASGQLGIGNKTDTAAPTKVLGGVKRIGAGLFHTLALIPTPAEVRTWGSNSSGQLGFATTTTLPGGGAGTINTGTFSWTPMLMSNATVSPAQVVDFSAGQEFSCALVATGVYCWGNAAFRQLGPNAATATATPTIVPMPGGLMPTQISSGDFHTCARLSDGTVACWGRNNSGQSVPGNVTNPIVTPTLVPGVTGAIEIAAGGDHSCVRTTTGAVLCWGLNSSGELGDGSTAIRTTVVTTLVSNVSELALGWSHTCARLNDGTMKCWGDNTFGQLALPLMTFTAPTPTTVLVAPMGSPLAGVTAVAAGVGHTCASTAAGVYCWGGNASKQIGPNGGAFGSAVPVLVPVP